MQAPDEQQDQGKKAIFDVINMAATNWPPFSSMHESFHRGVCSGLVQAAVHGAIRIFGIDPQGEEGKKLRAWLSAEVSRQIIRAVKTYKNSRN